MFHSHSPTAARARRGTSLALTAVLLVPLLGVTALVIDGGMLMIERRHAQAVADASALAAAGKIYQNWSKYSGLDTNGAAHTFALDIAAGNGYTNDGATSTVTVNIPPLSGIFTGKSGYAEVLVQNNQPKLFSAIWGDGTMSVTARAVARTAPGVANPAILLLDPSMKAALNATGNGNITATGGAIVVDSSNGDAGVITGNGSAIAPNINFSGGYNTSGKGQFVGTIQTYVAPTPDPLASLAAPDPSTLPIQSGSKFKLSASGNYTLQPGVYIGGIAISAPNPGLVTLSPGIYYMKGGGFSISGSINVTGNGVMIYNAPVQNSDQVKLTGSGSLTLTPPTSGTYKGITIFQLRSSAAVVTVTGNGSMNLSGSIYSAGAEIDVTGNGGTNVVGSQIIANNMKVTGNGSVNVDYNGATTPGRELRLVQ